MNLSRLRSPRFLAAFAAMALVGTAAGAFVIWKQSIAVAQARVLDAKYPVEPLLATVRALWFPPAPLQAEIEKRLKFELASFKRPIEKARTHDEFRALDRTLAQLELVCPPSLHTQIAGLKAYRVEHEEAVDLAALDALVARDLPYAEAARSFTKKYPASKSLAKVQTWLHRSDDRAEAKDRGELDALKVATRPEVEQKLAAVDGFLAKYPLAKDATEMRRATEVAKKLLATKSVKVVVSAGGRFNSTRPFSARIEVDGKLVCEQFSDGDAQEATWDKEVSLAWTPGQPITLILYDYRFVNEEAARLHDPGIWALRTLEGRRELEPVGSWEPYFEGKPYITCHVPDFTDADWALIETYFPPAEW